jgi:thiamine kinase-like enzyme
LKDFQPDYFSSTIENAYPYKFLNSKIAFNELHKNYIDLENITQISSVSGYGVNSQNIKIVSKGQSYLLKFWNTPDINRINEVCQILNHVNRDDVNAPIPIYNCDSNYTSIIENKIATLFTFIEGSVFTPKLFDLPSYFSEVNKLFVSLKNFNYEKNWLPKMLDIDAMSFSITNLCENKNSYFYDNYYESMKILMTVKSQLLESLDTYSKQFMFTQFQYSHYDLHPKNILQLSKGNFAFLDFESCDMYDPNLAWGFSLIKILRQVLVDSQDPKLPVKIGPSSLKLIKNLPFAEMLLVDLLPIFGRVEIMRRLTYIANAYENGNSTEWISMFPVQIQLLRESLIMFDQWQ